MVLYSATSQRISGRVSSIASKNRNDVVVHPSPANEASVPVVPTAVRTKRKRNSIASGAKRSVAGALSTAMGGPAVAGSQLGIGGLVTTTIPTPTTTTTAIPKAQTGAAASVVHFHPVPPPRPLRKATNSAAAAAASRLAAKVSGAETAVSAVQESLPIAGSGSVSTTGTAGLHNYPPAIKKSSLSTRKVGGGKATESSSVKRRVKFSANVHTYPSNTSTKKSARIGELQLKKRTKKLKRNRSRREGGAGPLLAAVTNDTTASISQEIPPKPITIGGIEDPLKTPRILRLNVVGKPKPKKITGKAALAEALRRKALSEKATKSAPTRNRVKSVKAKAKVAAAAAAAAVASKSGASASSSQLVEKPKAAAVVTPRKKATGLARKATTTSIAGTPLVHERQSHGKVRS
ncbi:uncharacterized protein Dana_GF27833 [Drosophila ananassae]|uniref:Uncharacterized protein n=1 Tax=Drosophila ananassae TaxID=7217 RepID=A0A0P9C7K9_DROAN|nr:flocculation protein FLO11 [Drosophila ananassae]XP_044570202.1 flocculation protein FLO11 [Drosophila ananassae]KPU79531.1 uncharacterized protein Dana_GF27833 [Drosophila ananassae]